MKPIPSRFILISTLLIACQSLFGQFLLSGNSSYSSGSFITNSESGDVYLVGNYVCNLTVDTLRIGPDSCNNNLSKPINFFVLKLSDSGQPTWLKSSDITTIKTSFILNGIFTDAENRLWIAGNFSDSMCVQNQRIKSTGPNDVFIARFNPDGKLDTLIGNFAYDSTSQINLCGFKPDASKNGLLYGSFKGAMKSTTDTLWHSTNQLFLAKIDPDMQREFLVTKLDTPIISSDSSAVKLIACHGNLIKMAISVHNAREYRIDTSYVSNAPNPGTTMKIDTVLIIIPQNTFITGLSSPNNFSYLVRKNYFQLSELVFNSTGEYFILDNQKIAGIQKVLVDKFNASNRLLWTNDSIITSNKISLKGKTMVSDLAGNIYWGGDYQSLETNTPFHVGSFNFVANKDKNALAVKLSPNGAVQWAQAFGSTSSQADYAEHHDVLNQLFVLSESSVLATGYYGNELTIAGAQIKNSEGINNVFVGTIDLHPDFEVTITPAGSTEFCDGDSVLLQGPAGADYTYQWTKNGNLITSATERALYAKDSATYGLSVFSSSRSITKKAFPCSVIVNPLPKAQITTTDDTVFCQGEKAVLRTDYYSGYSFFWYNNGNTISNALSNSYDATISGVYSVQVTSNKGCTKQSNAITIETVTPIAAIINQEELSICDGDSLKLDAFQDPEYQYQWYFEETLLENDTTAYLYAKKSGAYQIETTLLGKCQSKSEMVYVNVIPSPLAKILFAGDSVLCFGEQTTLIANDGFSLTYLWLRNNDTLSNETNSWINANEPGVYRAIVGFEGSCSRWSNPKTLVVNPLPEVTMLVDGETNICQGQQTLLSTINKSDYTYQWFRNNIEVDGAESHQISAELTGTYYVLVTNSFGCQQASPYQSIVVKSSPDATLFISGDTIFCEHNSVSLFTYDLPGQTYLWHKNGLPISNQTSFEFITTETGNYQVLVTNIQNQCESASRVIETIMIPAPDEKIVASKDIPFCAGDSVLLSVSSHLDWNYQWLYNGYHLYLDTLAQLNAKQAGNYSVQITNNYHCSATTPAILLSLLENPVPSINVNGLFLSTNENGTLLWNYNGEPITGATNPLFLVAQSGLYSVTAYYSNGCFSTSPAVSVCNPVPEITVDESFLTANEGLAYQWFFENEKIEGANQQTHRAQVSGNYTVGVTCSGIFTSESAPVLVCIPVPKITQTAINVLEASQGNNYQWYKDNNMLSGEDARVLVIKNSGEYTARVEDLEGCTSFTKPFYVYYSSVEEISSPNVFKIYPNPVCESLFIEYFGNRFEKPTQIAISDLSGKIIYRLDHISKEKQIEVSVKDFVPGLYWVSLKTESEMLFSKFVKQ